MGFSPRSLKSIEAPPWSPWQSSTLLKRVEFIGDNALMAVAAAAAEGTPGIRTAAVLEEAARTDRPEKVRNQSKFTLVVSGSYALQLGIRNKSSYFGLV